MQFSRYHGIASFVLKQRSYVAKDLVEPQARIHLGLSFANSPYFSQPYRTTQMVHFTEATLRFDGACQPNPGEGGAGYILINDNGGGVILEGRHYVGHDCTNNVAEYKGLIEGLKALKKSGHTVGQLDIEGDSELVIKQMKRIYRARNMGLRKLHCIAYRIIQSNRFDDYRFVHISRDRNAKADTLAREAIQHGSNWSENYY